jgi:hypothetical protein
MVRGRPRRVSSRRPQLTEQPPVTEKCEGKILFIVFITIRLFLVSRWSILLWQGTASTAEDWLSGAGPQVQLNRMVRKTVYGEKWTR